MELLQEEQGDQEEGNGDAEHVLVLWVSLGASAATLTTAAAAPEDGTHNPKHNGQHSSQHRHCYQRCPPLSKLYIMEFFYITQENMYSW